MTASESNSGTLAEVTATPAQVRRPVKLYEPESNASRAASSKPIERI
jgi:hypothetical protein